MADYRVGLGHNLDYSSLVKIVQEPTGSPAAPVQRNYGVNGAIHDQGNFIVFTFEFIETPELYLTLLSQFGVQVNSTAEVTIYARTGRLWWARFNGIAHYPEPGVDMKWDRFFARDINLHVTDLEMIV